MKSRYYDVGKFIVTSYFENLASSEKLNAEGYVTYMDISQDDKILLEHMKALEKILGKAIEELESEVDI